VVEPVKDGETQRTFTHDRCETLLCGFFSPAVREGPVWKVDDRGDPVVQISRPLIATRHEFDESRETLGEVLSGAWQRMQQ
jgi:hypothetical protein